MTLIPISLSVFDSLAMLQMITLGWFLSRRIMVSSIGRARSRICLVLHHALLAEPLHAPPVDRQLLQEEDAQPVAEREELGRLRVVRADQVDAGLLHQPQLVLDERLRRIRAEAAVLVVAVDAPDLEGPAVQEQLPAAGRDRPDSELRDQAIDLLALAFQRRDQGVQGRRLRRPRRGMRQRQRRFLAGGPAAGAGRRCGCLCQWLAARSPPKTPILKTTPVASAPSRALSWAVHETVAPSPAGTARIVRSERKIGPVLSTRTGCRMPPYCTHSICLAAGSQSIRGRLSTRNDQVVDRVLELARDVEREREIAVDMLAQELAVEPHLGVVHHPAEPQVLDLACAGP